MVNLKLTRHWLLRKDNVRQRYRVTATTFRRWKETLTYDFKLKAWRRPKIRVPPPPPPPTKIVWRITLAINFVVHHRYYAIKLQRWAIDKSDLTKREKSLEDKLTNRLERELGFKKEDWWFLHQIGIGYQPVPYQKSLIDQEEITIEVLRKRRK